MNNPAYNKHTVGFYSLGCAKNLSDTEIMLGTLVREGFQIVDPLEGSEIIIVNTCAFIESAKEESIETVLQAVKLKKEGHCRYILVTGCLSQRYGKQLYELIPEVDHIIGVSQIDELGWICRNLPRRLSPNIEPPGKLYPFSEFPKVSVSPGHYAYLKIAEGCNNNCSYCIIPSVRGPLRSRSIEDLIEEACFLNDISVRELIIIAQDITQYGTDLPANVSLIKLLERLKDLNSFQWIRLLYAHPDHIQDELLEIMKSEPKIVPYLDIPIQHVDQTILRKMGRKGNVKKYVELIDKIRTIIPDISLRTTVIVGFPGEKKTHFQQLLQFIKDVEFDHLGVFKYSRESGTRAAKMKYQVSEEDKNIREKEILEIQADISKKRLERYKKNVMDVLVEGIIETKNGDRYITARSPYQAPEVDGTVYIHKNSNNYNPGEFKTVKIERSGHYDLVAAEVSVH